jgi:hypothetical protein
MRVLGDRIDEHVLDVDHQLAHAFHDERVGLRLFHISILAC